MPTQPDYRIGANGHLSGWTFLTPWLLPAIAIAVTPWLTPWIAMWFVAVSLFAALKGLTWWTHREFAVSPWRTWGYFVGWPGLDAERFLRAGVCLSRRKPQSLLQAATRTSVGALLIWKVVPQIPDDWLYLKGAVGFFGLLCLLHFGLFDLLAELWGRFGVDAPCVMDHPFSATSLADFWGRRWNTAYRRVSYDLFFRPLAARFPADNALLASFLFSGVIHEVVISLPTRGGYGGPTAYFLIQGFGLLGERTSAMRNAFRRMPAAGRIFTAILVLVPAPLLFHPPFLVRVIVPFLSAIGA